MSLPASRYVANLVRIHQELGGRVKRRRLPRPASTRMLEREYARIILKYVEETRHALDLLRDELPRLISSVKADLVRQDAGESRRIRELIELAKKQMARSLKNEDLEKVAEEFAKKTDTFQRIQMSKQVRAAVGVDVLGKNAPLLARMERFVQANVALIKDVPEKILGDIEKTVTQSLSSGRLPRDLARQIDEKLDVGERRAKLIARDQIGKFYGQLNAERHRNIGIRRFIWRTANDDRVRDEHAEREGVIFSYDSPPYDGLPGEPINCRCYAEPVFDDILGEEAA